MWFHLIVTLTGLFITMPGFAHGADQHVLGTVMAIDAKHVEVKTSKGQVDVQVNKKTRYKDERNPKGTNMPEVGDRVIIKATKGEKKSDPPLLATEIHFSAARRVPAPVQPVPVQ
ncbi:MAG TPA: DUF5666 domain-containing protein [Nitrospiraceae bacterium]|nr:DUF5666 domain-containing protein [Nitrospiraceae bacterium]